MGSTGRNAVLFAVVVISVDALAERNIIFLVALVVPLVGEDATFPLVGVDVLV